MTKVSPEFEVEMPAEEVLQVSVDVSFTSNQFPKYRLGADSQILEEPKEDNQGPSLKEVVEQETSNLSEQHKRLSVRDLASKFDKNLAAAAKLSDEAKLREVASLEGHVLLKKLRDALETLRGRLAGRNKEDVEKAISMEFSFWICLMDFSASPVLGSGMMNMVEALAVKLTQKEGELIQEKFEVKKLANFLKQASEDAKKLVNQEKSFACAEIESARAVVLRIGEALEEEEINSQASKKQVSDVEELVEEVQEARRIKLLHQPSKVMDMDMSFMHWVSIRETSISEASERVHIGASFIGRAHVPILLQLAMSKRDEENKSRIYMLEGSENLGSYLRIQPCSDKVPLLSKCSIQWYRLSYEGSWKELISGANKSTYAPEPFDVGRTLQVEIVSNGQKLILTTAGPIDPAAGLGSYVETLLRKSNAEFNMNGQITPSHLCSVFHVGKMRIKLSKDGLQRLEKFIHHQCRPPVRNDRCLPRHNGLRCLRLDNKPKEQIVDIDAADAGNDLAAVEYVEDIYKFYKLVEHENRLHDYIDSQPEINESMRAILVDWLIDVHKKFELSLETLYLTLNIV
ncbi:G2/mitotic-specific cyclin S13-6 [Morella rubra]|uniref:B-like cyclin n=1 Tax=Morella rubra TaxID=262757 RepID=A0A6A1UIQ2_9ROSI|nr:G2/mitotic-specific cyclin S13-6 [Morella rubra]